MKSSVHNLFYNKRLFKLIGTGISATIISATFSNSLMASEATFLALGVIPNIGMSSNARSVSDSTNTAVGSNQTSNGSEPSRWTIEGGMMGLGDFNGSVVNGFAVGVSANGSVIAGAGRISTMPGYQAFVWTSTSGVIFLGDLPGGVDVSQARDISADGNVIVGYGFIDQGQRAFVWTQDAGFTNLGTLDGTSSTSASGVSGDGMVVVGSSLSASQSEAFRWSASTGMQSLGASPNGAKYTQASAVSYDGSVITGKTGDDPNNLGDVFVWNSVDGIENLGHISSSGNIASATSSDGSIIVGGATSGPTLSRDGAFVWTRESGFINLQDLLERGYGVDLTGWTINSATDISPDGTTIVGYGYNSIMGRSEGFKATIPMGALPCTKEVKHDGVDQDCNGHDLTIDDVTATYKTANRTFKVEATSSFGKNAALTIDGLGAMKYNGRTNEWSLSFRKYDNPPSSITVRGVEGFVNSAVIYN